MMQQGLRKVVGEMPVSGIAGLIALLEVKRGERNWSWRDLAAESGIGESTFSKWRHTPELIPDLYSLAQLSVALKLPLRQLIEACGFPIEGDAAYAEQEARARALVAAVPQLQPYIEQLATLTVEEREDFLAWMEARRRRGRKKG